VITRTVKIQLAALALVAIVGVLYAGFRYADLGSVFGATTYPVTMKMAQSGGIFTGADVTYRGVSVGRVGPLTLTADGVDVQLDIKKSAPEIPADASAEVHNLSAIGEQYVDLLPSSSQGPMLAGGSVIPADRTSYPVPVEELVGSLDNLVRTVPLDSLRTTVDQLGVAFANTAQPLQQLLDTTGEFTQAATDALPQTTALIDDAKPVLKTQNDTAGQFKDFSHNLALVAEQLKKSDPDLRRVIQYAPPAAEQISALLDESGSGIGELLANTLTISRVLEPRQANLNQIFVTYPGLVGGVLTVVPGGDDPTAHLGLVLNVFDPPPCTSGYEGTAKRKGDAVDEVPVNANARCAEPRGSVTDVRGAQNAPQAGVPGTAQSGQKGQKHEQKSDTPPDTSSPAPTTDLAGLLAPLSNPAQILG
jgi:phospholipid/cholesterol/gamma-HCH transport system substrate-binding protein